MDFTKHALQSWRKIRVPYRLQHDPYHLVFVIEALDRLPDQPRLWIEGDTVVLHHSVNLFLVLGQMSPDLIAEISQRERVTITEQHAQHYNESIVPWGMDKVGGTGRTYDVPVIHIEKIGDIRKIFNALPESPIGE
jgi:hypothetical protein